MGTCYSIYAEVRVGNKWYNISPLIRELDGQVKAQPFLSGKSMLHETVEQLREYSYKCGRPDDLSDELRTIFGEPDDDIVDPFFHEMTYKEYYRQSKNLLWKLLSNHKLQKLLQLVPLFFQSFLLKVQLAE